jgi:hypothetical protein
MKNGKTGTDMPITMHPVIEGYWPKHTEWIPNWRDSTLYDIDPIKTDRSRWAWEFLRRNRHFQHECDSSPNFANPNPLRRTLNAKWGVYYKSYQTEYASQGVGANGLHKNASPAWSCAEPKELIDRTEVKKHLSPPSPSTHAFVMAQSHVAALFDLNSCLSHPDLLNTQIQHLSEVLHGALERHQKRTRREKVARPNHQNASLRTYLRVADALACAIPPTRAEIGKVFQKEGLVLKDKDPDRDAIEDSEFGRAIQPHIEDAFRLIYGHGYLSFLAD